MNPVNITSKKKVQKRYSSAITFEIVQKKGVKNVNINFIKLIGIRKNIYKTLYIINIFKKYE